MELCHAIIDMAHHLGVAEIAEGIETKAQKDISFKKASVK
jgi:sensor c-di-GMP phosphodiesterase-like protein|tara:strand:- start:2486 stop:2605 length:120 start_codon:yes stop_codon:yes gene_type:complete